MYHKKKYIDQNVYDKTLERLEYLYRLYDEVIVSFSGGKDSTAMLLCAIDVATRLGKLPVKAVFYDEEAIHPPTIEYIERIRNRPDVDLEWYCLPIKHRNACSNEQPFWHCWHPEEKHLWVRDMPEWAISEHPRFKFGMSMQDFGLAHFKNTNKVVIQGIRTGKVSDVTAVSPGRSRTTTSLRQRRESPSLIRFMTGHRLMYGG